jgi:predicted dehydrogenase
MSTKLRVAVFGAGAFGRNHARVLSQMKDVELTAVVDLDVEKAKRVAHEYGTVGITGFDELPGEIAAAIVATPTVTHETVAEGLLGSGVDVLVEKPIADSVEAGGRLTRLAEENGLILQVGHLERFNPAVAKLSDLVTVPLFFEVHRLSLFTPRSLDVDVVLDLMIHDLDIVLQLTGEMPSEVRAAGISVLSSKVDIANVRLAFAGGCVANLTASRVSTEQVRKLRLFQPGEYLTVDYQRQDLTRLRILPNELKKPIENKGVGEGGFVFPIGAERISTEKAEPLALELASFVRAVRQRSRPKVDGTEAIRALQLAGTILATIEEHASVVNETIQRSAQLK